MVTRGHLKIETLVWNETEQECRILYAPCMANGFFSDMWDIFVHEYESSTGLLDDPQEMMVGVIVGTKIFAMAADHKIQT